VGTLIPTSARAATTALPIRRQWEGGYPVSRLDQLPAGQQEAAAGAIGDPLVFRALWRIWKPGVLAPHVDFGRDLVLFARNTRTLNRLRIGKVTLREGVARLETSETRSAIPIGEECNMVMAVVARTGIQRIDTWSGAIDVPPSPRATAVRIQTPDSDHGPGTLFATLFGKEQKIADHAWSVWIGNEGRDILYSQSGAGGYEGEGQELWRYRVTSGVIRRLLNGDAIIRKVVEAKDRSGRLAYVVSLSDGAVGAPRTAIVHPRYGQVFYQRNARVARIANGRVALNLFRPGAFDTGQPQAVKPIKTIAVDLYPLLAAR
jgi:hypothetical protein